MKETTNEITGLNNIDSINDTDYPKKIMDFNTVVDKNEFEVQKQIIGEKVQSLMDNNPIRHPNGFNVLRLFKPGEILNSFIEQ